METDLRPPAETALPVLGSGWGGGGWGVDDSGDDWGWSEGPSGDDDDSRPYRRSRVVRAVALVTAATVVLGSIGTWVAILAVGPPRPSFSVASVSVRVPSADRRSPTTVPMAKVTFVVGNDSNQAGRAVCRATATTSHGAIGRSSVRTHTIAGGESASLAIGVPLSSGLLSGNGPATIQVSCLPLPLGGSGSS
jgi:hypothetical protein